MSSFILFVLSSLLALEGMLIECGQHWEMESCECQPHCQWVTLPVCDNRQNRCRMAEYGCRDRDWCRVTGNQRNKKMQCSLLPLCIWKRGRGCVARDSARSTCPVASLEDGNNMCWFMAFNGECNDCAFQGRDGHCWCYRRSDFSDCYAKFGQSYLDGTA